MGKRSVPKIYFLLKSLGAPGVPELAHLLSLGTNSSVHLSLLDFEIGSKGWGGLMALQDSALKRPV